VNPQRTLLVDQCGRAVGRVDEDDTAMTHYSNGAAMFHASSRSLPAGCKASSRAGGETRRMKVAAVDGTRIAGGDS
jgi:hypothetical protein